MTAHVRITAVPFVLIMKAVIIDQANTMNAYEKNLESINATLHPRFESHGPLLIAGLQAHYTFETLDDIPKQWELFVPQIANVRGRVGEAHYGLCMSAGGKGFDYVTGVQVAELANLPAGWVGVRISAQTYAIFSHPGHVSTIRDTAHAIEEKWLPKSGREPAQPSGGEPNLIERYGRQFDPNTGTGDIELWLPIKA
jgi:AraC family transcriptional regulator